MSPVVQPLGPTRLVHGIPITPVCIDLLDGCQLRITAAPADPAGRLAGIAGTLLYSFTGTGIRGLLSSYTGITQQVTGVRVATSFRVRTAEMRPAGLAVLTRPRPYLEDFLLHLESAALKHLVMRTRALNTRTSVGEASRSLPPADRALADALARQIADAVSTYALGGLHLPVPRGYRNARDLAVALIHRLRGRAVDVFQVVAMLEAAGAGLTSLRPDYVARRDLIQRERDGGNIRVGHLKYDGVAVFYPTGILTPAQALADYTAQRRRQPHGRLPIPAPASTTWCPCPYCTPTTDFVPTGMAAARSA